MKPIELAQPAAFLRALALGAFLMLATPDDAAAQAEANYDESAVPAYTLPDPLRFADGREVKSASDWPARRAEILELFRAQVYGRSPAPPATMKFEVLSTADLFEGRAVRKVVAIRMSEDPASAKIEVDIVMPKGAAKPVPIFVGMHLFDRKSDPIKLGGLITDAAEPAEVEAMGAAPGPRMLETLTERGYAVATLDAKDFAPDDAPTYDAGIIQWLRPKTQTERLPDDWAAMGAWAWALSRALDYFETDPAIDAKRAIAIGHSRMGKTALWAGAQDGRFAMVVSNQSGCGGAALSKRIFGETVKHINDRFPHWFSLTFRKYNGRESDLPLDQHMLVALIAPRPVYIGSAEKDRWADPKGEFLSAVAADPVYRLLKAEGLGAAEVPEANMPVGSGIRYHVRSGKHALTDWDWMKYLAAADKVFSDER